MSCKGADRWILFDSEGKILISYLSKKKKKILYANMNPVGAGFFHLGKFRSQFTKSSSGFVYALFITFISSGSNPYKIAPVSIDNYITLTLDT